ncbi:MAG TPA: M10 family metallopeptidase C-terminal domain-containing protein, partial [Allosphingosinicella sp.]
MPIVLSVAERNDAATTDAAGTAQSGVQGIARASRSSTGTGTWFQGTYGALLLNSDGSFIYRLDHQDPDTNALGAGQTADDRFTYTYLQNGIVRTDTITIRVAGIDEADQQVTSGGTVAYTDDATVDAHRQIRIDDHAVTLTAGEDDHVVLTNHGMIRANAIGSEAIGVQVTVDFPWTGSATLVNRGLIESYVGPASHLAYGVNASTGPAFDNAVVINHGVIRAISEATGTSYSQVYGAASANLVNTGTVEAISTGEVWATYVGTYGSLDNQGFIYAQGATAEYAHGIAGVRVGQASRVTISNSGTIHAVSLTAIESIGIVMFRDSTNHYAFARVDNSGTIVADIAIKAYATSVGGITGVHAYNSGRVEGDFDMDLGLNLLFNQAGGTWIGDIRGGINEDAVRNRGLIDGMVALGDGHDLFDGRGGVQTGAVSGGAGNDTLLGSDGSDDLSGGDGIDYIAGGGGADSLAGGAGGDVFSYHAVGDSSSGAFDTIADFVSGTDWIDLSALSPSSVTLAASGGFTMVNAVTAAGTVTIRVGGTIAVSDVITAPRGAAMTGTGADEILFATLAGSQLNGAGGNDVLEGSIGADLLDGGAGSDQMRGGAGNDVYFADAYEDRIVEFGGEGVDELRTSASQRLQAYVENLTMLGGAHIFASGNDLANVIIGNSGWNEIIGEGGDDVITGGGGADTLGGGDGRDVFVYLASSDSVSGASDQLSDFRTGDDRIDLRAVAPTSVSLQETMLGYWQGFAISNVATIQTASGTMTIRVTGKLFLSDFILGNEIVGTPVADSLAGDEDGNVILGGDGDDSIIGLAGMDTLAGQDGNDRLDGGTGADQMTGGRGDDVYIVDDSGDYVWEKFAEGYDVLIASTSFTLGQQVFVERLETANAAGTEAINLTGNTKDNLIIGNAGNNILDGGRTNDPLGGEFGGRDRFIGYGGDDVFIVDGSEDVVVEAAGGGRDTVIARNSYVLTAGAEVEILKAATDAFNPIDLTGNEFAQSIWAGATLNNLDGRGGADSFVFASVADSTSEQTDRIRNFQSGIDRIDLSAIAPTSVTWVSATDASDNSAYNLVTVQAPSGTMTLRVYGSLALADFILQPPVISGTANDDVLVGTAGDDELRGLAGNDSLDGRAGADLMVGGIGNDVFLVDNAGDMASEAAGEGVDLVESSIGFALGDEVENLTLTGSAAINGTGNALANAITGNEAANVLDGGTDNDRLIGGLGADQLIGGLGDDTFVFDTVDSIVENAGGGTDTVESAFTYTLPDNIENLVLTGGSAIDGTGNSLVNSITGNGAANRLDGGLGADVMNGGGGSDTFIVDNVGDTIVEAVVGGTDTAESSVSYTIGSEVERLTLTGTASINGTGNGLANIVTGNSGDNVLDGGVGTDLMIGGLGNDTFVVDNGGDSVSEQNGSGTDTVRSAINYTLGDWVENLVLLAGAATGTGNGLANGLTGNDAANTLDGKGGADGMAGGLGDDLYIIDNVGDLATEATSAGTDSVQSSVSFTLGANVEHLVLLAGALNGTGNGLANAITGNGANNMLNGMGGADILSGGLG